LKRFIILLFLMQGVFPFPALAKKLGDFNGDGFINIVDVIAFALVVVKNTPDTEIGLEYVLLSETFSGRIKTSENAHRIEIGDFGTDTYPERIRMYTADRLVMEIKSDFQGPYATGSINLISDNGEENNPETEMHGMGLKLINGANLILPDWKNKEKKYVFDKGDVFICWDYVNDRLMLKKIDQDTNPEYTINPDKAPLPAIGRVDSIALETPGGADYNKLVDKINAIIQVLGQGGQGLTVDTVSGVSGVPYARE